MEIHLYSVHIVSIYMYVCMYIWREIRICVGMYRLRYIGRSIDRPTGTENDMSTQGNKNGSHRISKATDSKLASTNETFYCYKQKARA